MLLIRLITPFLFFAANASAIDLMQDEKAIECNAFDSTRISITKSDDLIFINTKKFIATDFLDTALLGRSGDEHSFFQATQNDEGFLITGKAYDLVERPDCKTNGFSKVCSNETFKELDWSSTQIKFTENDSSLNMKVVRYGVYPVDGTYFIARNENKGAVLIDYGSKIKLVVGEIKKLKCSYQ